jgi:predicted nucleic acid-binding protein
VSEIAYLDICCFKRPFDDPAPTRILREAEAVAEILERAQDGRLRLVRSPAHDFENERNPREDRRLATQLWLESATVSVTASDAANHRARELSGLGFGPLDALHLAFAEACAARWFVTTDDRLLKTAMRHRAKINVDVVLPEQVPLEAEEVPS